MKTTLVAYRAQATLATDKIHLNSGTVCRLSDTHCVDSEGGHTFWTGFPEDRCQYSKYTVIYEGKATKMTDPQLANEQIVYSLVSNDIVFALTSKSVENVCGHEIVRTEHPKLMIHESKSGSLFKRTTDSVHNLDIFTYVNSKFVYVEKHLRTQMKSLYLDVVRQRCALERETIKNSVAIAAQSPYEFAYNLMKGPGYMALVSGEVAHIIQCVPVELKVLQADKCYAQL